MSDFLDEIVRRAKADLQNDKRAAPLPDLMRRASRAKPAADFARVFLTPEQKMPRVIAELKKASPSAGMIRPNFDPESLARELAQAGAAALSVLTQPHYFLGAPDCLQAAACAVDIPLLRKDFIFDEYQICQARAWGASAVLLIAAMLDAKTMQRLRRCAEDFGMQALCEAHSEQELEQTLESGARIVGVNCRDLRTFCVDPERTRSLIGAIPKDVVAIAESGMASRADIDAAAACGARGFLIGTALMKQEDPAKKLRELLA